MMLPLMRSPLSPIMRAIIGARRSGFSAHSLFAQGQQGAWYDPSDFSTLFQDSVGTIPVTGMEQPVGLMLDKSKGLVRGPERVYNGDFSAGGTYWAMSGGGWSISDAAALAGDGTLQQLSQSGVPMAFEIGKTYEVVFNLVISSGSVGFQNAAGTVFLPFSTSGTKRVIWTADGNTHLLFKRAVGNVNCTIDAISVKEIAGNHASQPTAAQRPILTARKNLLLATDTLSSFVAQTGSVIKGSAVLGPCGQLNAFTLTDSGSGDDGFNLTVALLSANLNLSYSVSLQKTGPIANLAGIALYLSGGTTTYDTVAINTNTGATYASAGVTTTVVDDGGWWRVTLSRTANGTANTSAGCRLYPAHGHVSAPSSNRNNAATGSATFSQPQLTVSLVGECYQWVNTATDYDYAGFPIGLKCDGVDDGMVTGSIDFTGTDKMFVCAGVRKLSDAAVGVIVELSVNQSVNPGAMNLVTATAVATYQATSRGSLGIFAQTPTNFPAPITNVVSAVLNIGGDITRIGVDSQSWTNSGDQGTGNYGNYPLYLFRRGAASLPFNGIFYGAIIAGAAYAPAQIAATERYLAGKSGVTL